MHQMHLCCKCSRNLAVSKVSNYPPAAVRGSDGNPATRAASKHMYPDYHYH